VDVFSPEKRSEIMSRIRSSGTRPERRLGEILQGLFPGEEILERPGELPGRPDWFLPGPGLAVFMDGCFWHGCPRCWRPPESNAEYWREKVRRNRARDRRADRALRAMGLLPVRVRECELGHGAGAALRKLRAATRRAALRDREGGRPA
jgi:DNA mismatch endonuclease (patch repair protein)